MILNGQKGLINMNGGFYKMVDFMMSMSEGGKMVDFKSFAESCKWRQSKVCKAIQHYCELDNCALYGIMESVPAATRVIIKRRKRKKVAKKKTET